MSWTNIFQTYKKVSKQWFLISTIYKGLEHSIKPYTHESSSERNHWIFIGRTDAEAEAPILWPPDVKSWLTGKDPDAGKDGRQEEKGTTEDKMAGWHHWLNGRESQWTLGVGDGQGGLACCDSWGHKESDTTEWLNWTELNSITVAGLRIRKRALH